LPLRARPSPCSRLIRRRTSRSSVAGATESDHRSGDDVRQQPAFQFQNFVLQAQLSLFQVLDLQLVERCVGTDSRDDVVEVAVFAAHMCQLFPQNVLIFVGHRSRSADGFLRAYYPIVGGRMRLKLHFASVMDSSYAFPVNEVTPQKRRSFP